MNYSTKISIAPARSAGVCICAFMLFACVAPEYNDEGGDDVGESEDADADTTDVGSDTADIDSESTDSTETDVTDTDSGESRGAESTDSSSTSASTDSDSSSSETTGGAETVSPSCANWLQNPAGLSFHILQGQCMGGVCTFEYDPAGEMVTQIAGSYTTATGEFSWTEAYHPEHWRSSTSVSGVANFDANGDESSSYTVTTIDSLGEQVTEDVILERSDCVLLRTTTAAFVDYILDGEFVAQQFTYTEEQVPAMWTDGSFPAPASGTRTANTGVHDEVIDIEPSGFEDNPSWTGYTHERMRDDDGNDELTFNQWDPFFEDSREGLCSWDLTGTQTCEVEVDTVDWGGTAVWTKDYSGNGEGVFSAWFYNQETMEWGPQDCPIAWVDGSCSYSCPGGQNNSCSYFLWQ